MSRGDLSQPWFVDAMVSGYGKAGGFLERIEKAFDWSAFEVLLSPIHASRRGAPGYPPLAMVKILLLPPGLKARSGRHDDNKSPKPSPQTDPSNLQTAGRNLNSEKLSFL